LRSEKNTAERCQRRQGGQVPLSCSCDVSRTPLVYTCKTYPFRMYPNTSTSSEGWCLYVRVCLTNSTVHWNRSLRVLFKFLYVSVARVATAFSRHTTSVLVNSVTVCAATEKQPHLVLCCSFDLKSTDWLCNASC